MAKWGQGDPRWIVEDRADGTNVNNWHWTEKDASVWSKDKLKALLEGLQIEDGTHCCKIKELTKIEGEAVANNRKAKLIFFYEWVIKASWTGNLVGNDEKYKGTLEIPNLSEENSASDIDVVVATDSSKDEAAKLKEFVRTSGANTVRDKLAEYIEDLQKQFSQGMILPSKEEKQADSPAKSKNVMKDELNKPITQQSPGSPSPSAGLKIPCKRHTDKLTFKCRSSEIYRALTEKQMVAAFTRNEATIQAEKGGKFALFGGTVTGKFTSLEPNEKIEMKWRFKAWPTEHHSDVVLRFTEKEDCTEMTLVQTGVPADDLDRTVEGWKRYYWQSINHTFGFGSELL